MPLAIDFFLISGDGLSFRVGLDGESIFLHDWKCAIEFVRNYEKANFCRLTVFNFSIYNFEENVIGCVLIPK